MKEFLFWYLIVGLPVLFWLAPETLGALVGGVFAIALWPLFVVLTLVLKALTSALKKAAKTNG